MALLYQVDFRALATQAGLAAGAVTIDSLQWWLKGNLAPGGGLTFGASLEAGAGLRLRVTGGTPVGVGSSGDLNEPHFFLPLSHIAQYSSSQALLIRGRFTRSGVSQAPLLGVADSTNDAVGLRAAVRAKDHFCGIAFTSTTTASVSYKAGTAAVALGTGRAGSIANSACVPGILNNHLVGWGIHGNESLASGLPADINSFLPASGNPSAGAAGDPHFQWTTRSNPGVFFGVNATSAFDSYLQWLRIDTLGEINDVTAPRITNVTPATSARIGANQPISLDLIDVGGSFVLREFLVRFGSSSTYQQVHDGASFKAGYSGSSVTSIANGYRYSFVRDGGWPYGQRVALRALCVDGDGNVVVVDA